MPETAQAAAPEVTSTGKRGKNEFAMEPILLVEDKAELRAMLRKALERAGYAVDDAADGIEAVTKIRARRYLLVLTDLKLPGRSGIEILRESKLSDPSIPVILITAYGSIEEAVTAMRTGLLISYKSRWIWTT